MKHTERIKRIKERRRRKENISISVDTENFKKAREILLKADTSISEMFDMFLEDFVFEELSEVEQKSISMAEIQDLKKRGEINTIRK